MRKNRRPQSIDVLRLVGDEKRVGGRKKKCPS